MNDLVFIRGLNLFTVLGVHPHEQLRPRRVILDLEMAADIRTAATGDDLDLTPDYEAVSVALERLLAEHKFLLVETLAERCAECVISNFGVSRLKLRVSKPAAVAGCDAVGVIIERAAADYI